MKYIYILGLILLICILYSYNIKEGNSNIEKAVVRKIYRVARDSIEGGDPITETSPLGEKYPSVSDIKERKCNELSICDQLKREEYEDCGYCLADEFDISKPYSFHYGYKGGAHTINSNCYHSGEKYTGPGGVEKRNIEWVAPSSKNTNTRIGMGSFEKCKEIKTKHTCEKQKQCNFLTGKEANIDKELNCGWCLDKTSDVGGNPFVRNISNDPNDLKKVKANVVERIGTTYKYTSANRENKHPKIVDGISCAPTKTQKEAEDQCNLLKDCGGFWRYAKGSKGDKKAAGLRTCYKKVVKQKDWWKNNYSSMSPPDWKGAYHEKVFKSGIKKNYYCSNNENRKNGEKELNDILSGDYPDNTKCKYSQIEKEHWKTIEFPKFKAKHGTCGNDLIKKSDCSIFLKESCMKKSYNEETGKEEDGPFIKDKTLCIKDLWEDIGFIGNFENFEKGIYVTEDGEEKDTEIMDIMGIWKAANNFGEIQASMIKIVKEKIHSKDFYTAKKWNKILLNKNVCSEAFDTEKNEISPNTELDCVNPCYQYQIDGTEWENTPKECQVKIFKRNGGQEKGLVHPIKQSGKMPSVLQFFEGSNIIDGFTTRDIEKSSIINNEEEPGKYISLNNKYLQSLSIGKIDSHYENIKNNISNDVSYEKKYKASLQLIGEAPSELENKLCWVEFVKIMRTYPGTKIGNTYQDITINDEMKNKLGNIHIRDNSEKSYKIIDAYLKIVEGNTNNWILKKKTYEDPGFDFRPWNKVLNDYWKEYGNWIKFMHLMMKQDNVILHLAYEMYHDENKEKIEISEKSPFYNLINSDTCTYTKNMFLLKFDVTNLGSGATLYIKNSNHQQKETLSNGENEILLHPNLYNGTKIELIPLVKSSLTIKNATLIRIRDVKQTYKLKDYKKTSLCDNVWNYCYWDSSFYLDNSAKNNTNLTPTETKPKMKYLLKPHRTSIDFTKFFGLISNDDFIDLKYKSLEPKILIKTEREIKIETKGQNTINRKLTSINTRKDTKFELKIKAKDQNWGWRSSRIELDGKSNTTIGIGGRYNPKTGNGVHYGKNKSWGRDLNTTYINRDVTNNVVNSKENGGKVKMDLTYYTGHSGHETYIYNANLSVKNTPDNEPKNINLLNGIPGNRIKVKGKIQRRRSIPEKLKWVTIRNGKPQIDNSDSYTYKLTGKGAGRGSGGSKIHGSNLSKHRAKTQVFNLGKKVSEKVKPLSEIWENINLSGKINQHNTDRTIKIESETSHTGGQETYIKDLKLNILKNNQQLSGSLLKNKKISINGNVSKDLGQGTNLKIWEGFQNNEPIENIIINKLDNIKNYFFPEKEGFWMPWWLNAKKKKKKDPFRWIFKLPKPPKLKKGAQITFKGKDQGWGNDCNAHLSVNGKKSKKFGHKWKSYKINFDEKIKTTSNTFNVNLHKYSYPGCEVHVKDTKVKIKNPSDIKTQNSTKTYDIGNHSVTNRSGGKVIFNMGEQI